MTDTAVELRLADMMLALWKRCDEAACDAPANGALAWAIELVAPVVAVTRDHLARERAETPEPHAYNGLAARLVEAAHATQTQDCSDEAKIWHLSAIIDAAIPLIEDRLCE